MTITAKYLNISDIIKFKGGDDTKNIYEKIIRNNESSRNFMLRYYQVIPKYYLISKDLRKLILSYSTGSGKSATSVFIVSHFFDIIKKNKFLMRFGLIDRAPQTNIQIIGSWVTENAFIADLLRPEFGLVSSEEIEEIEAKKQSPYKEIREEGDKMFNDLKKTLTKTFNFCNFQSVFNKCFPTLSQQKYIQNIESLFVGYRNKDIKPSESYLESLRDSIVIVDEFQKMYSSEGMNTFGFVIGLMLKYARKYNIRFVFLSATMINNSLAELPELLSILREDTFINVNDYIKDQVIDLNNGETLTVKTLKEDKEAEIIEEFKDIFLYYDQRKASGIDSIVQITKFSDSGFKNGLVKGNSKEDSKEDSKKQTQKQQNQEPQNQQQNPNNLKVVNVISNDETLPVERHIGNVVIGKNNPMCLYTLEAEGYQDLKYSESVKNESLSDMMENDDEENEEPSNCHDGFVPPNVMKKEQGVIVGEVLKMENLKQYSKYGYELVKMCINNTLKGEKTVIYHEKIFNFGLKQYIEILKANGFIEYGTIPKPNTLCTICGKQMAEHTTSSHQFIPMRYAALFGNLTQKERHELTAIYNDANNLYGELINVMFISKIASSGLSFYNTNNLIILSRISNISLWKQICGRVVRTKSHALLPKEKHFVNIYTFCLCSSKEKIDTCHDVKYYMLRNILNEQINDFMGKLSKKAISNKLFDHPEEMGPSSPVELAMFNNDINTEMTFIFKELGMKKTLPWKLSTLIKRIRDTNAPLSFIDFNTVSDDDLISYIIQKHFIRIEKFKQEVLDGFEKDNSKNNTSNNNTQNNTSKNNINNNTTKNTTNNTTTKNYENLYCIPYKSINEVKFDKVLTSFNFKELEYITIDDDHIKKCISELSALEFTPETVRQIKTILTKLLKLTNYKIDSFKDNDIFWDAIYYIHDEYYEDDNKNFVYNHCTKGRKREKVAGFYCNNMIIMKDGSVERLNKSTEIKNNFEGMPYGFKITSFHSLDSSCWYLQVVISETLKDVGDKRKQMRGICCTSFETIKLKNYISEVDYSESRKMICWKLLQTICDLAISLNQVDRLLTPF